ncbi:Ras-related protein RabC [Tritrichomonas foetus]|uniref:Ras-related protein RabC n=1 Tax=Tritrichomonas foetus TaxID=1144522 RepID=A0A1J4J8B6_9EUKA|nr:Ras-related protein RabC [Tritrichomonas foetus]|eukprot:OHS95434.1 Ras-related protein RabC [Tritrichomonas foetus]
MITLEEKKRNILPKVIFCGNASVGKTSIISKLKNIENDINTQPTMPVAFSAVPLRNNPNFQFNIWDTAGQETYKSLIKIYFRDAKLAVVVCDITSSESYDSILNWIADVEEYSGVNCKIIVVANKCDKEDEKMVEVDDIKELAESCKCKFIEVSAKSGFHINELADLMIESFETDKYSKLNRGRSSSDSNDYSYGSYQDSVSLSGSDSHVMRREICNC